jgi:hypothetical protein
MTSKRAMPLGLQYIYTDLACCAFARSILPHPCAAGGRIVDIWTRDPRKLETGEVETFIHAAVLLPDGCFLDVEGIRPYSDLCSDFGIAPQLSDARPGSFSDADLHTTDAILIRSLADLCGWAEGAPLAADCETASSSYSRAVAEFESWGGMRSDPTKVLSALIAEYSETIQGLTKLVRLADDFDFVMRPEVSTGKMRYKLTAGGLVAGEVTEIRGGGAPGWYCRGVLPVKPQSGDPPQFSNGPLENCQDAMDALHEWFLDTLEALKLGIEAEAPGVARHLT